MTAPIWSPLAAGALFVLMAAFGPKAEAGAPELGFPVACQLGTDCFVQNYVDIDPSDGVRDFRCGSATYNGHKGTDIRLLSIGHTSAGVAVLAAAPGIVKAVRDGMPDQLIGGGVSAPAGRECGNGLVIDHGDGWETQYCHLLRGSIAVVKGVRVARGARLGSVGYSGKAAFAHLHLSVRRNGSVIDPFIGSDASAICQRAGRGQGLWMKGAITPATGPVLIDAGFSARPLDTRVLEIGLPQGANVAPTSPALIFYARYMHLEPGDAIRLAIDGPAGFRAESTTEPLPRLKAQYVAFVGRKLKAARWPAGRYRGEVTLLRGGRPAAARTYQMELP